MKIKEIKAREILNCRGLPTVECSVGLTDGKYFFASVPLGISVGSHASTVIFDGDIHRYGGKGMKKAIHSIEKIIAPKVVGMIPDVIQIDFVMLQLDGTANKSNLGVNALLPVSMAVARAQAASMNVPLYECIRLLSGTQSCALPRAMFNMINGGQHAQGTLLFQEFLITPCLESFSESLECAVSIYQELKKLCKKYHYGISTGEEGGLAPLLEGDSFMQVRKALDLLIEAVAKAGFKAGQNVMLALDVAASEFYNEEKGSYSIDGTNVSAGELIRFYDELIGHYPLFSIEDGLSQDDWDGWAKAYSAFGNKIQLVGDDLFATHIHRIKQALHRNVANACLIKPDQVGTVSETLQCLQVCKDAGFKTVVSHRSGETNDSFIVDLAVGGASPYFKAGACIRGERIAKYNRLLEIEEALTKKI